MHRVFCIVTVGFFEFGAMEVLLTFLAEQALHLIICKAEKGLYVASRKRDFRSGCHAFSRFCRELQRSEEETERCGASLGRKSGPFEPRVKSDVNVRWTIAADLATSGENGVLFADTLQVFVGRRDVQAVPVRVVGGPEFCAAGLRTTDVGHHQLVLIGKPISSKVRIHPIILASVRGLTMGSVSVAP